MKKWVAFVWCCFILRGTFYSSVLPLWEGFDEWAHFGVIEQMRATHSAIIDRHSIISDEIAASFFLAPLPRGMTNKPEGSFSHERYWSLPHKERETLARQLSELSPSILSSPAMSRLPAYEASQPPLYYALLAGILTPVSNTRLLTRVWIARYVTVFIASLAIPIGFCVMRSVFENNELALVGITLLAAAPGFVLNHARIGNDSLAVAVFTLLIAAQVRALLTPNRQSACLLGTALGVGLLTKAYFLTAIPAIVFIYAAVIISVRSGRRRLIQHSIIVLTIGLAIGGWWYLRNILQTGTLSGLDEAMMVQAVPLVERLHGILAVQWWRAIATVLLSHVWYAGWSLLALPRWLYYGPFAVVALASVGAIRVLLGNLRWRIFPFVALYGFFWIGHLYQILMLFLSKGSSTAMGGWYLHAVAVAEIIILFFGLADILPARYFHWISPSVTIGLVTLDVYGLYVTLPYYVQTDGEFWVAVFRLLENKPFFLTKGVFALQWVGFCAATIGLIAVAMSTTRALRRPDQHRW
jgi:hypothetical protein